MLSIRRIDANTTVTRLKTFEFASYFLDPLYTSRDFHFQGHNPMYEKDMDTNIHF